MAYGNDVGFMGRLLRTIGLCTQAGLLLAALYLARGVVVVISVVGKGVARCKKVLKEDV